VESVCGRQVCKVWHALPWCVWSYGWPMGWAPSAG